MTVALCGTSIESNAAKQDGPFKPEKQAGALIQGIRDAIKDEFPEGVSKEAWDRVTSFVKDVEADSDGIFPPAASAELSSIKAVESEPKAEARLVLIASDTLSGVVAALVNACAVSKEVNYWAGPPPDASSAGPFKPADVPFEPTDVPFQRADVVRISGLVADSADDLSQAVARITRVILWAREQDAIEAMDIHLTGGYKATVPIVVAAIELMDEGGTVRAWTLHEDSEEAIQAPVRPQGLRDLCELLDQAADNASLARPFDVRTPEGRLTPMGAVLEELCAAKGNRRRVDS